MRVNPRQFPLIRIIPTAAVFIALFFCIPAVFAEVAEIAVETKLEPSRFDPQLMTPRSVNAPILPLRFYAGETSTLNFPRIPLRHHRSMVSMHERYLDRLIHQTVLDIQMRIPADKKVHGWDGKTTIPGLGERILIASHQEIGKRRAWNAHLHRADFEVLATALSLSEINRYQFRRNRPHSEGIPVKRAGSGD
jgi:hypothetical protein